MKKVIENNGEGLMLRKPSLFYVHGRSVRTSPVALSLYTYTFQFKSFVTQLVCY